MSIIILGFSSTDKVPGFYAETVFGAGGISFASVPIVLLLTGNMLSTGTSTADQNVDDIFSETDASTLYGSGSELHRMCRAALRVPGIRIKAAPVAEAGGAAAATATLQVTGTWTAGGSFIFRVGGDRYACTIGANDSIQTVATNIAAAINSKAEAVAVAAVGGAATYIVTFTMKSKGTRGNQCILALDKSQLPSGMDVTLAGGGASVGITSIYFANGTGTDDVTNVLAVLYPGRYNRIAASAADATNAALWKTQINNKAGVLEGRMEHVVMANNTTSMSTSKSIAQTTLNDCRFQYCWLKNAETLPSEIAAVMAAVRTQHEQSNPNSGYDGVVLPGVVAQSAQGDWASRSTQGSCLDNSLTPLISNADGTVSVVRAITTHSLRGANPDYTTLDTAQSVVPDAVRDILRLVWTTQFLPANPNVRNEPSADEPRPPQGVAFPSLWAAEMTKQLRDLEQSTAGFPPILTQVSANLPVVDYDSTAQRIMAICPVVPLPLQHQIGVSVRQLNAA